MDGRAWWAAVHGVTKSQIRLSDFTFTFHFHALAKEMATHSSVLAWRIPGMEEPGGLPSLGLHSVRQDWSDLAAATAVHSLGKTLLAFALLHSIFQLQICLLPQVFLDFLLLHSSLLQWKGHIFWVLVLKGLIGLHRTIQLQLLQHYWLGHRLGLLWYWMVCLGSEQRLFSCFWDCIQVLHFRLIIINNQCLN